LKPIYRVLGQQADGNSYAPSHTQLSPGLFNNMDNLNLENIPPAHLPVHVNRHPLAVPAVLPKRNSPKRPADDPPAALNAARRSRNQR
jgi:hypothetical protein